LFRLHAASCISSSRETDDLALGSRSGNTASGRLGSCRRTRNVLSGLVGDEIVEIGIGEHAAHALAALADADVAEIARGDVRVERLDRTTELSGGLRGTLEPAAGREAQLAGGTVLPPKYKPFAECPQAFRTITVLATESCESRG